MHLFTYSLVVVLGCFHLQGECARMDISPSAINVVIGGDSSVTTTTPQTVVLNCNANNIGGLDTIFSMYLRRDNQPLAEISLGDGTRNPELSNYAPSDVANKNPQLEGDIGLGTGSYLQVTYLVQNLDCVDGKQYHCSVIYKPTSGQTANSTQSSYLTVHVVPGNLVISAALVENSMTRQISNLSIVQPNDELEVTCTGDIGGSSAPVIEWHRTTPSLGSQRYWANEVSSTIDDGYGSQVDTCHFRRTSVLRYRVSASDSGLIFHCEVQAQQSSGLYRAYSAQFKFTYVPNTNAAGSFESCVPLCFLYVMCMLYVKFI